MNKSFIKRLTVAAASLACVPMLAGDTNDNLKPNCCKGATLCHNYPVIDSGRFHFDIGILAESAYITGTDYASNMDANNNPIGEIHKPDFNLDVGITAGIGYNFLHDDWMADLRFNWINSTSKTHTAGSPAGGATVGILPTGISFNALDGTDDLTSAASANAQVKSKYYTVDLAIERGAYTSGRASIVPGFGLQASWINITSEATFLTLTGNPGALGSPLRVNNGSDFWGVGPKVQMDTEWALGNGFALFSDFSAALLFGDTKVTHDVLYGTTTAQQASISHASSSPTVRYTTGFQWDDCFYDGQQYIQFRLGFDASKYWNQNSRISRVATPGGADAFYTTLNENNSFSLMGLIADLRWSF